MNRSLPRMRGDRPRLSSTVLEITAFTPHARGSTFGREPAPGDEGVYPACAGIDPSTSHSRRSRLCLPRMRGDRPSPHVLP